MDIKVAKPTHARAQGPEEVIKRYRKLLKTFCIMTEAFNCRNVDRATIDRAVVDPNTYERLASTSTKETLAAFAKQCAANITEQTKTKIATSHLVEISSKYQAKYFLCSHCE
ncbi:hypothetical protein SRHO_G00096680 [Serrasalmus rhombeus]